MTDAFGQSHVMAEKVSIPFTPLSAFLVVWDDVGIQEISQAAFLKTKKSEESASSDRTDWYVGGEISVKNGSLSRAVFIVAGEKDQLVTTPVLRTDSVILSEDAEHLAQSIAARAQEVWELQNESRKSESTLRTLKQNISVLGDLGRIIEIRDQQKQYEGMLQSVNQEEITLRDSLAMLKAASKPGQYKRRELELLRAFSELNKEIQPYREQLRKIERSKKKDDKEINTILKRISKIDVGALEQELSDLKEKMRTRSVE